MKVRKRLRAAAMIAGALCISLVATACGSEDSDSGSGSGSGSAEMPRLKVSASAPVIALAGFWIADGNDLFAKHGVDVQVTSYTGAATMAAELASGQVDVGLTSVGFGLSLPAKGIKSPMIFGLYRSDWSEFAVIAGTGFTSYEDLAAKGTACKAGQYTPGSTIYGYMELLVEKYAMKCQRVKVASPSDAVGLVKSGQLDVALTYPYLLSTAAGGITVVMDPNTTPEAEGRALFPTDVLTAGVWATEDAATNKREALEGFVAALREAHSLIQSSTPEQLAEITAKVKDAWGTAKVDDIAAQWKLAKSKALDGQVSEQMWKEALDVTKNIFKSPVVDPSSPNQAYGAAVDMTLLKS